MSPRRDETGRDPAGTPDRGDAGPATRDDSGTPPPKPLTEWPEEADDDDVPGVGIPPA